MTSYFLFLLCEYIELNQLLEFRLLNKETKYLIDNDVLFFDMILNISYDSQYFHTKDETISFFNLYIRMKQMIFSITKIKRNILKSCGFESQIKYLVKFEMKYGIIDLSFIHEDKFLRTININIHEITKKENKHFDKFTYHENVHLDFELPSYYNCSDFAKNDFEEMEFVNKLIKIDFINNVLINKYYTYIKLQNEFYDSKEFYIITLTNEILKYNNSHEVETKWSLYKKLEAIKCYLKEFMEIKLLK